MSLKRSFILPNFLKQIIKMYLINFAIYTNVNSNCGCQWTFEVEATLKNSIKEKSEKVKCYLKKRNMRKKQKLIAEFEFVYPSC